MDRHSEVLIQGTNVPGGRITVNVPVDHTFATDFARNTYPYDGAQYIWRKSWNVGESNTKSRSSSSSSSSGGGCLTLIGLVFLVIVGGVSGGGDDKPTPTETPQPAAIERVEYNTPPAPVEVETPSSSGPCVTDNFEPC